MRERGEIWLANLDTGNGAGPGKARPVLIVQAQALLDVEHPATLVAPLTSELTHDAEPLRIRIPGDNGDGYEGAESGDRRDAPDHEPDHEPDHKAAHEAAHEAMQSVDVVVDQLRAIDNRRLVRRLGAVAPELMERIDEALFQVLELRWRAAAEGMGAVAQ